MYTNFKTDIIKVGFFDFLLFHQQKFSEKEICSQKKKYLLL